MPALQSLPPGQTVIPFRADPEGFSFDVYDVVTQRFSSQHFDVVDEQARGVYHRVPLRVARRVH